MRYTLSLCVLVAAGLGNASCSDRNAPTDAPPRPEVGMNAPAPVSSTPLPPPAGYSPPPGGYSPPPGGYYEPPAGLVSPSAEYAGASGSSRLVWHATPSWAVIKNDK